MEREAKPLSYEIPDPLKRTLKKGEYAAYQLIDVFYKDGKFSGRTAGAPNQDLILHEGELIPIAFVEGREANGSPRFGNIWFDVEKECTILCLPGAKHAALYQFLEISNYNEGNPNRDPQVTPLYRRVDSASNTRQTREERSVRAKAVVLAARLSNEEIVDLVTKNKQDVSARMVQKPNGEMDWEASRDSFERWVEKFPDRFLKLSMGTSAKSEPEIEELVAFALANNVVRLDRETKTWYGADGKPLLKVKSVSGDLAKVELVGYLKSSQGEKVYDKIRRAKLLASQ
jgi:hypothetical protein